jgi:uncharacterized protein (TIGR01777 family)
MHVVVSGGSGFVGTRLASGLIARGHQVTVLTRDASRSRDHLHPKVVVVSWAPGAEWEHVVDGAGGLVNLAGENLAKRWTKKTKERIVASRVGALERLLHAVEKAKERPSVLVSASAVGYYGPRGDEELTEESAPGDDFLARTCRSWEEAALRFEGLGMRVATPRFGLVLGEEGGALAKMLPPFRAGLGGPLGNGKQWISWIHADDLVSLLVLALESPDAKGAINAVAPAPVRMNDFARALGRALHRPAFFRVPARVLKAGLGEMSTVVLDGQRVLPARAEALGFTFRHHEIGEALRSTLA